MGFLKFNWQIVICCVLIFVSKPAVKLYCQNLHKIDSLQQALQSENDKKRKVDLLLQLSVSTNLSDTSQSIEYINKARRLSNEINYLEGRAGVKWALGRFYFATRNFNSAFVYISEALGLFDRLGDEKGVAKCLIDIGNIYVDKNEFTRAVDYLEKGLKKSEKINYATGIALSHNHVGAILDYQGEYEAALDNYEASLKYYFIAGDLSGISAAYHNIGLIHKNIGNYVEALKYIQKSLAIDEKIGDKYAMSYCYNNIGQILRTQKDYENALKYYLKSLAISKELGREYRISACYNDIGNIHEENKNYPQALKYFRMSLQIDESINDKYGIAVGNANIGLVYFHLDSIELALKHFKISNEIASKLGEAYIICWTNNEIATCYLSQGEIDSAYIAAYEAYQLANEMQNTNLQMETSKVLSDISAKKKKFANAYKYLAEYQVLHDTLLNEDNIKEVANLEAKYQFEKEKQALVLEQQKKEAIEKEKLKRQKAIKTALYGIVILLVIIILIIYKNNKIKQKSNKELNLKNQQINQQKEEIITQRDDILDKNQLLSQKNIEIIEQKQKILDSIKYAKKIQDAVLPKKEYINEILHEYFMIYRPREIVSGDFFWIRKVNGKILIAVADCTGHGVPGALMSMLGITFLNDMVNEGHVNNAGQSLDYLRERVKKSLQQANDKATLRDGMDIALCIIDKVERHIQYAGANSPLYILSQKKYSDDFYNISNIDTTINQNCFLYELKPDRQPVSIHFHEKGFNTKMLQPSAGDTLYLLTDGLINLHGGPKGKKFQNKRLKKLLIEIFGLSLDKQKQKIEQTMRVWQNNQAQVDDILIVGFKI